MKPLPPCWKQRMSLKCLEIECGRNRTFNQWIKSPLLYQLSYAPVSLLKRARLLRAPGGVCQPDPRADLRGLGRQTWAPVCWEPQAPVLRSRGDGACALAPQSDAPARVETLQDGSQHP